MSDIDLEVIGKRNKTKTQDPEFEYGHNVNKKKLKERKHKEMQANAETLFYDFGDYYSQNPFHSNEGASGGVQLTPTNAQFYTTRPNLWVEILQTKLSDAELFLTQHGKQLKIKIEDGGDIVKYALTVHIYNNGTVMIQGGKFEEWCRADYKLHKELVDRLDKNEKMCILDITENTLDSNECTKPMCLAEQDFNTNTEWVGDMPKIIKNKHESTLVDTSIEKVHDQHKETNGKTEPTNVKTPFHEEDNGVEVNNNSIEYGKSVANLQIEITTLLKDQHLESLNLQQQAIDHIDTIEVSLVKTLQIQQGETTSVQIESLVKDIEVLNERERTLCSMNERETETQKQCINLLKDEVAQMRELNKELEVKSQSNNQVSLKIEKLLNEIRLTKSNLEWCKKELTQSNERVQSQELELKSMKDKTLGIKSELEEKEAIMKKLKTDNDTLFENKMQLQMTISGLKDEINSLSQKGQQSNNSKESEKEGPTVILFKGSDNPLSNLYMHPISIYTHEFHSPEGAHQYRHAVFENDFEKAEEILLSKDSWEAMKIGDKITKGEGWYNIKESTMSEIISVKYETCKAYREALKATGTATIMENTTHTFWGKGTLTQPGLNKLGQIHMKMRKKAVTSKMEASSPTGTVTRPKTQVTGPNRAESSPKAQNVGKSPQKEIEVTIVGNSLTKNLTLHHLKGRATFIEANTIGKAKVVIDELHNIDTLVIHEINNDIGRSEQSAISCATQLYKLAQLASSKANKVIISTGTPNGIPFINGLVHLVNERITELLTNENSITCCYHFNLYHNGYPQKDVLANDGNHLNTNGKAKFASNLVATTHKVNGLKYDFHNYY